MMMSECEWPDVKPTTGYRYGCRCDRCSKGHSEANRRINNVRVASGITHPMWVERVSNQKHAQDNAWRAEHREEINERRRENRRS